MTPWQFLAFRFTIGTLLFVPFVLHSLKRTSLSGLDVRRIIRFGVGVGVLLFLGFALQAVGMKYTTASRSGFFTGLLTLMVPLIAMAFRTSRTSFSVWIALPVALAGIYLLVDPELGNLNIGDLLTIGCALAFAFQMVGLEATNNRLTSSGVSTGGEAATNLLTLAQMVVISLATIGIAIWDGQPLSINRTSWWGIGYTAVFGSLIAVWLQTKYQPKVPASYAGMIFTLEPLWAALFAWLLLGDPWTGRALIGAGFILLAMVISSLGKQSER